MTKLDLEKIVTDYLEKHDQLEIVSFLREITDVPGKNVILEQLKEHVVDNNYMSVLEGVKSKVGSFSHSKEDIKQLEASKVVEIEPETGENGDRKQINFEGGLELIQQSKVAVVILAGGQGTRLGSSYPKGMFSIGLPSQKSLFQIHIEKLLSLKNYVRSTYNKECSIPIYIMTSDPTHTQTTQYFKENNYFTYPRADIVFFKQKNIPSVTDPGGKILLTSNGQQNKCDQTGFNLVLSPDGNGSIFEALKNTGVLNDLKNRHIEGVQVFCVDNLLAAVGDPEFYGMCRGVECGAKAIEKVDPCEKVGVLCLLRNAFSVVEYSEISDDLRNCSDPSNPEKLLLRLGNICIHYFSLPFLEKICSQHLNDFPFHSASKTVSGVLDLAFNHPCTISPEGENRGIVSQLNSVKAIKLEKFIFDCFPHAESYLVKVVHRQNEFAPLKNGPGSKENSPETCLLQLTQYNRKKLKELIPELGENQLNQVIEISSLYYYDNEALRTKVLKILSQNNCQLPPIIE